MFGYVRFKMMKVKTLLHYSYVHFDMTFIPFILQVVSLLIISLYHAVFLFIICNK